MQGWIKPDQEYSTMFLGKRITLQLGQLITGLKIISEKFNISESKVQNHLKANDRLNNKTAIKTV